MRKSEAADPDLLAEWTNHRREAAFHEIVVRYAGLVHATARRTSGDDSLAAEATQLTFILLARKAGSLTRCASLAGWLHRAAIWQTKNLIRQTHRENRKRQQLAMETPSHQHHDTWREIQPVLDDALAALSDKDREALLLRFYRSLTIREVAATLGIATDAAQKRIDRATERLRGKLLKRGCQSGGALSATLLAGFSADAQAALPVSILTSKAIAAGASVGGLTVSFATIATLMKTSPWIPPVVAFFIAGVWTGTKYQSLATVEAGNARLRDQIALAETSRTAITIKTPNDDASINWQRLATEEENGPEFQRLRQLLKSMTREEMIAALDHIAMLECSKARRINLKSAVVSPLGQIDPEWVLNRFQDRLRDNELPLASAFGKWAGDNLSQATAWFDAQIAAGNFDGKQLDENNGSQPRHNFEAVLIDILLTTDPAAAELRIGVYPVSQRESMLSSMTNMMCNRAYNQPLTEGNHLAFANLVRRQLPEEPRLRIIAECTPSFSKIEEFPKLLSYMDVIEATTAERICSVEEKSGGYIRILSSRRKVTVGDLEVLRGHFSVISPEDVDAMTARALLQAVRWGNNFMRFPQASGLAIEWLEASGSEDVLVTILENAPFGEADKDLGRTLAGKITDISRRTEILKRFK